MGLEKEALEGLDRAKCGILVGTAMGGMQTFSTAVEDLTLKVPASYTLPSAMQEGQSWPQRGLSMSQLSGHGMDQQLEERECP